MPANKIAAMVYGEKKEVLVWQDANYVVYFPCAISNNTFNFSGLHLSDILLLYHNDSLYIIYSRTVTHL